MKKSVFTLLAIAFAVITMSSCSQNDGGSSNDLNLKVTSQSNKSSDDACELYQYQATVTNDVLEFFDVTITRNVAGETKTYDLSNSDNLQDPLNGDKTNYASKTTGIDIFRVNKGGNVTIKAIVTPKANWKSILDSRAEGKIKFLKKSNFSKPGTTYEEGNNYPSGLTYTCKSEICQEGLEAAAEAIALGLSFSIK